MTTQTDIDATLRLIGCASPSDGIEDRIQLRLEASRGRRPALYTVSVIAIAASLAIAAIVLNPLSHQFSAHEGIRNTPIPRTTAHAFGGASAVHVPTAPIPVGPTPIGQGRGHERAAAPAVSAAKVLPPVSAAASRGRLASR
jgi:hypothetical protein